MRRKLPSVPDPLSQPILRFAGRREDCSVFQVCEPQYPRTLPQLRLRGDDGHANAPGSKCCQHSRNCPGAVGTELKRLGVHANGLETIRPHHFRGETDHRYGLICSHMAGKL